MLIKLFARSEQFLDQNVRQGFEVSDLFRLFARCELLGAQTLQSDRCSAIFENCILRQVGVCCKFRQVRVYESRVKSFYIIMKQI